MSYGFAILVSLITFSSPTLDDIVCSKLEDLSFTASIETAIRKELKKINKDFAFSYEAEGIRVLYKEPLKLKVSTLYNGQEAVYVIKGDTKYYHVPRLNLKRKDNIAEEPGKRQTLLDFGLITKSMKESFLNGNYVRTDSDGNYVFDLRYQYKKDYTRFRVWVDPQKKYIVKKMWYNQHGELMATFEYSEPVHVNSVWFPGKIVVKNAEGKLAGISRISNVKVNTGIPDSEFSL